VAVSLPSGVEMKSIYQECPPYETEHFAFRLVRQEDAPDLLACYSDAAAVKLMNSDACTSDFHYTSLGEMEACISLWRRAYAGGGIPAPGRRAERVVGTVEIFGGEFGVLRIDLRSDYETAGTLDEIIGLAVARFYTDLGIENLVSKAIPQAAVRSAALRRAGFVPTEAFRPGLAYYLRARSAD
jgi:ribosomal-protein-alanine N-acetyltransferase